MTDRWPEPIGYHVWRMIPMDYVAGFGTGPATFQCERCWKFTKQSQPRGAEIDYPDPVGCEYVPSPLTIRGTT